MPWSMNQSNDANLLEKNALESGAHVRQEEETVNELWKGKYSIPLRFDFKYGLHL